MKFFVEITRPKDRKKEVTKNIELKPYNPNTRSFDQDASYNSAVVVHPDFPLNPNDEKFARDNKADEEYYKKFPPASGGPTMTPK